MLQEFYVTVTRKLATPLAPPLAYRVVQDFTITLPVVPLDANLILLAIHRSQQDCFSFWDALVIEVALKHGATILYTEDLQDGRQIGELRIKNPFL